MKQLGKTKLDSGGGNRPAAQAAPPSYGGQAPPMQRFKSGHVEAHQDFSKNLMKKYLSKGGAYYG
jgi:hypothetical protein